MDPLINVSCQLKEYRIIPALWLTDEARRKRRRSYRHVGAMKYEIGGRV